MRKLNEKQMTPFQASFDTMIDNWIDNHCDYIQTVDVDEAVDAFWEFLQLHLTTDVQKKVQEYLDEVDEWENMDESLNKNSVEVGKMFESLSDENKQKVYSYMKKLSE